MDTYSPVQPWLAACPTALLADPLLQVASFAIDEEELMGPHRVPLPHTPTTPSHSTQAQLTEAARRHTDKSWEEIIPAGELARVREVEDQQEQLQLYLPPRQRKVKVCVCVVYVCVCVCVHMYVCAVCAACRAMLRSGTTLQSRAGRGKPLSQGGGVVG